MYGVLQNGLKSLFFLWSRNVLKSQTKNSIGHLLGPLRAVGLLGVPMSSPTTNDSTRPKTYIYIYKQNIYIVSKNNDRNVNLLDTTK